MLFSMCLAPTYALQPWSSVPSFKCLLVTLTESPPLPIYWFQDTSIITHATLCYDNVVPHLFPQGTFCRTETPHNSPLDPALKKPQKHKGINASMPLYLENSYAPFKTQLKYPLFLCLLNKRTEGHVARLVGTGLAGDQVVLTCRSSLW